MFRDPSGSTGRPERDRKSPKTSNSLIDLRRVGVWSVAWRPFGSFHGETSTSDLDGVGGSQQITDSWATSAASFGSPRQITDPWLCRRKLPRLRDPSGKGAGKIHPNDQARITACQRRAWRAPGQIQLQDSSPVEDRTRTSEPSIQFGAVSDQSSQQPGLGVFTQGPWLGNQNKLNI